MLGVCRGEDDERLPFETTQDVGAEQLRHLHVEKDELGPQCVYQLDGGFAVGGFTDHLEPVVRAEHYAQPRARDRLVVDDDRGDLHDALAWCSGTVSTAS